MADRKVSTRRPRKQPGQVLKEGYDMTKQYLSRKLFTKQPTKKGGIR